MGKVLVTAKLENVDRLAELSTIGARVVPDNAQPR